MNDRAGPSPHLQEEPQEDRGAPGSRDKGSDQPAGGPADRPAGTAETAATDTAVDPQGARDPGAPPLPTGDQAG